MRANVVWAGCEIVTERAEGRREPREGEREEGARERTLEKVKGTCASDGNEKPPGSASLGPVDASVAV